MMKHRYNTSRIQKLAGEAPPLEKCGVKYQQFVNRSDERGGSTIGPISSTHIDINSVDIGSPILSMHSVRELGSVEDHYNIYKTFVEFYQI